MNINIRIGIMEKEELCSCCAEPIVGEQYDRRKAKFEG
jgi:hypothetical protein